MDQTFGEFIRTLRVENRMTLTQLAAKLGIDSGALSKIENGKKTLDQKALPRLADTFKLELAFIKDEFYSELIAKEIHRNSCSDNILALVQQKMNSLDFKKITSTTNLQSA